MATCAKCKRSGVDVAHVKACFGVGQPTAADYQPMAVAEFTRDRVADYVPDSDYALQSVDGTFVFYRVKRGKQGTKWAGFVFVDRLVGAPGDWMKYPVKGESKFGVLCGIAADARGAAIAFSREHGVCACCGSPLSDPESIALGLGPVCAKRFAA